MKKSSTLLSLISIFISSLFLTPLSKAATGIAVPSMTQCDTLAQSFVTTWGVQGLSLSISYQGRLIYSRAFGHSDAGGTKAMQPHTVQRVASISKALASTGIMKLVESGQLDLDEHVFGPSGILSQDPYFASANVIDPRLFDVTVRHLLEHTGGWNELLPMTPSPLPPYPWGYPYNDPGSFPLHATLTLGEPNPARRRTLIKWRMQRMLDHNPGTVYNYSNTGFAMLAEVIEKKSGQSYKDFMQANVFGPMGIFDIKPGKSLLADLFERESEYFGGFTTLSATGNGQMVPWYYGGFWVENMDGYGGMTATTRDLVRFLNGVDGFNTRPDILDAKTLNLMVTPSAANSGYAKGWGVAGTGWFHNGQFDGTASLFERRSSQVNFAININEVPNGNFRPSLNPIALQCMNTAQSIPEHDLFDVPEQPATNFTAIPSGPTSLSLSWSSGNGTSRVVVMKRDSDPDEFPLDGTDYKASGSSHHPLGGGNFIVYSGSGNSVEVTGLAANANYRFRVYEFNKTTVSGNNSLYQLGRYLAGSGSTAPLQNATISGRVSLNTGRVTVNAVVELIDASNNIVAVARTSPFGYYYLTNALVGHAYTIRVRSKTATFADVPVTPGNSSVDIDIVGTSD